ncbi:four-carbon acid sugar kinase family protein [Flavobacterium flavipallidum]|uniref:Four-carbon acid sugar kinase family protein n=1 Tax=Flavobacterium flavipallidum TaxID=3139140 RepID=A0ABU9HLH0_9FLAO
MIAVISDDFTGAAEIGGIGLRNGFTVTIDTSVNTDYDCDILVIATDTRSLCKTEAQKEIKKVTEELLKLRPDFIYKKTDSLLRGRVGDELDVQLHVSGKKKVLLVPANPSLNRTIVDGVYYINKIPLMESGLFEDEFDQGCTSNVIDLIGNDYKEQSFSVSLGQEMPCEGFIIGNTPTNEDLMGWASAIDETVLPAGGAGFFNAILAKIKKEVKSNTFNFGKKALYVCGSNYTPSREVVRKVKEAGGSVLYMPKAILCEENAERLIVEWSEQISDAIEKKDKIIIAVDTLVCKDLKVLSERIRETFARVIKKVLEKVQLEELLIEGGATAYSIIEYLEYKKFYPEQELAQGVIRMRIEQQKEMYLTLKPGSYQWTESIWKF